jgi:hypothetical protein
LIHDQVNRIESDHQRSSAKMIVPKKLRSSVGCRFGFFPERFGTLSALVFTIPSHLTFGLDSRSGDRIDSDHQRSSAKISVPKNSAVRLDAGSLSSRNGLER